LSQRIRRRILKKEVCVRSKPSFEDQVVNSNKPNLPIANLTSLV
jgi:hypothetical protein